MRGGLLPVGIPTSQRDDYYTALESADRGKWDPLVEMLCVLELSTISRTETIAKEPERRAAWIEKLSTAAAQKEKEIRTKRYLLWKHCVEAMTNEFATVAAELHQQSSAIGALAKPYDIDVSSWQEACRPESVPTKWLLTIEFLAGGHPFYRSVFVLRKHEELSSDLFEQQEDLVGIYVTGTDTRTDERPSFETYSDPHIRLREIVYVGSNLYVYSESQPGEPWDCRDDLSIGEVVEELFEDVFLRKAGIAA
jgi:hypothetical protein